MMKRVLLGMLTPSSNTVLEPLVNAMVAPLAGVSAHFSRFRVTEITLGGSALRQFDDEQILDAAGLLADAKVDVIAWNGTSGGWLGFERDERLCRAIAETTGISASTSVLALNELLRQAGTKRMALVTPYTGEVQDRIVANYRSAGFDCVAEAHFGISANFEFSNVPAPQIRDGVAHVARARPEAIATFCTNLDAARLVPDLEREFGLPVYDTVSTAVWKSLKLAGIDTRRVTGWGRLFEEHR